MEFNYDEFIRSVNLLFTLLNPFLMSVYLLEVIQRMDAKTFARVLTRAAIISTITFCVFALFGMAIFRDVLQVRFASFQIFGGLVFLAIGIRFVFHGAGAIEGLRGEPEHLSGAIAMPFMIGPGTVSASVLAGANLRGFWGSMAICVAVFFVVVSLVVFKHVHDIVKQRNEALIQRYVEIVGRISALYIGTVAVEMILQGIETWLRLPDGGPFSG